VLVSGHELLLEVIPSRDIPSQPDTVYRALKRFYNLGIYPDWWKLAPMSAEQWQGIDALIAERDVYCRGVVMLGLNASLEKLAEGFAQARQAQTCRGFMVGRTIFQEPCRLWLAGQIDDAELSAQIGTIFESLIALWRSTRSVAQASTPSAPRLATERAA